VYKQLDTGLKTELLENFNVQPTEISALDFTLSSNLMLTPLYGKFSVFNRRLIHLDVSLPFGVAMARYVNPQAYLVGPDVGIIFRVFRQPPRLVLPGCSRLRVLNHWDTRNEVHVALGAAFAWGGDER